MDRIRTNVKAFFHPYLLPLKGLFFFQLGAQGAIVPYIPLYIQHLGLNASENAFLYGSLPFFALISKPLTGALSDKLKAPYALIRIFSIIQLVFFFSIFFVPRLPVSHHLTPPLSSTSCKDLADIWNSTIGGPKNISCTVFDGAAYLEIPSDTSSAALLLHNAANRTCNCSQSQSGAQLTEGISVRWTLQFWLTGLLLIIGWWGYAAVITLDDSVAFGIVNSSPVPTTYGANRVAGTMGWAIFPLIIGFLIDQFSETSASVDRDFTPMFATFAVAAFVGLAVTFALPKQEAPKNEKLLVSVTKTIFRFDVLLFCSGAFVMGINSGMLYGYLGWYQTELGATSLLVGITVFVQCCYEAPMMAVSGWIIDKIGYHGCMILSLLSFGIRFIGYGVIWNPWLVLLIDITHSVGFGLFYAALTNFAFDKAPPGGTATLQGILGAAYEGFGQGIGGIAAGLLYQQYGGRSTWLGYGVFSFVAAIFYVIGGFLIWRKSGNKMTVTEPDSKL